MAPRKKPAILSKEVIFAVCGAIVAVATCVNTYFTVSLGNEAAVKVEEVAVKAEVVKQTLDESTQHTKEIAKRTDEKLDDIRTTVNSGSLVSLRMVAELSHWKAERTKLAEDIRKAEEADKEVEEHIAKQKIVDAETENRKPLSPP